MKLKKYLPTLILSLIFFFLWQQTFVVNNLREILHNNNKIYQDYKRKNIRLLLQQIIIKEKLKQTTNDIIIESIARYRFGFVQSGEKYYKFK